MGGRGENNPEAEPRSLLHHSQPDQECSIFQRQEVAYLSYTLYMYMCMSRQ